MQFSPNVYVTEPLKAKSKWETRWFEPDGKGGTRERRKRFATKEEAYDQAAKADAVLKKVAAGVVEMQAGVRLPLDIAAARYQEWLLSKGRTPSYTSGRIRMVKTLQTNGVSHNLITPIDPKAVSFLA
jgi:hypothetical protein